jgi:3-methyl-2-oxobutanoate hydroxymethyltransferase
MNIKKRLLSAKKNHCKLAWLTAYDYPSARLLDETGIDLVLVGDSLGMVVLGREDTVDVSMEEMIHHVKAVRRGVKRAPVAADLPFGTYDTPDQALENAKSLVSAGADVVKLEGTHPEQIAHLIGNSIEVIGHLGMLPQQVRQEGGYRRKGKSEAEAQGLLESAMRVQEAGCCAVVLELVQTEVASRISCQLDIPTIGIGSGSGCDGQILVLTDLLGLQPWFRPSFVKPKADMATHFQQAVKEYISEVRG